MKSIGKTLAHLLWGVASENLVIGMVLGGYLVLSSFVSMTLLSVGISLGKVSFHQWGWMLLILFAFFEWGLLLFFIGESRYPGANNNNQPRSN